MMLAKIRNFVRYILLRVIGFNTNNTIPFEKIIDAIYKIILLRPADPEGLHYYSEKLKSNKITFNELIDSLQNSVEYKSLRENLELSKLEDLRSVQMNTDNEWEEWGKNNPYYGVLTHEKYRSKNLDENVKLEFFESGKKQIEHVISTCRRQIDKSFSPEMALDFGCGVGRLTIPLAKIAGHVVGVDVS